MNEKIIINTGFIDIDKRIGGFRKSELIVLASRPEMRKSAFALNIAANVGIRQKIPTLIFSLEMSKEQVANRILSSESNVDIEKIRTGKIEKNEDWVKLKEAEERLSGIYIDDRIDTSITEICTESRRAKKNKNIGFIIIDNLQLIKGSLNCKQDIIKILKSLAKELNIVIMILWDIQISIEKREDKRLKILDLECLHFLRENTDIVMSLYNDYYYNKGNNEKEITEVIIEKNRDNNNIGTEKILWIGEYTKFTNIIKR